MTKFYANNNDITKVIISDVIVNIEAAPLHRLLEQILNAIVIYSSPEV